MVREIISKTSTSYRKVCRRFAAWQSAQQEQWCQGALFAFGVLILCIAIVDPAFAQRYTTFNDDRVAEAANLLLMYLEGSFGALVMVVAGLGAILGAAFGQYKAALGLLVVAVGSFILRSVVGTFFNDDRIRP